MLSCTLDALTLWGGRRGGDTEIRVWEFDGVAAPKEMLTLRNPAPFHGRGVAQLSETNGVAWDATVRAGDAVPWCDPYRSLLYSAAVCLQSKLLFTAAGDNNAYAWDLESGRTTPVTTFSGEVPATDAVMAGSVFHMASCVCFTGHGDYLHAVTSLPSLRAIATGSEDGAAKLWGAMPRGDFVCHDTLVEPAVSICTDVRSGSCTSTFAPAPAPVPSPAAPPSASSKAVKSSSAPAAVSLPAPNWVGAVAADPGDNWLAVGSGSGTLAVYHIGSRILTAAMLPHATSAAASVPPPSVHSIMFHEGQVRAGLPCCAAVASKTP